MSDGTIHPLRALRERRGLTQEKLARRSGVSERTISYIEGGRSQARVVTRRRLLDALGIDFSEQFKVFGPLPRPGQGGA